MNVLACLIIFLIPQLSCGSDSLYLNSRSVVMLEAGKNLPYLVDESGTLLPEDLDSVEFSTEITEYHIPHIENSKGIWIKLAIVNTENNTTDFYLEWPLNGKAFIREEPGFSSQVTGRFQPISKRSLKISEPMIHFFVEGKSRKILLLYIDHSQPSYKSFIGLQTTVINGSHLVEEQKGLFWESGIFFGILFFIAVYNLIFFLTLKDRSYLLYVMSIFSIAVFWANGNGYLFEYLFPDSENALVISVNIGYFSLCSLSYFYVAFTANYLNTASTLPTMHKMLKGMKFLALIFILLGLATLLIWKGQQITFRWLLYGGICYTIVSVITAVMAYRKKYRPAGLFLAGIAVMAAGIVIQAGGFFNRPFLGHISWYQAGVVGQIVIFSFGLAQRLNLIRDEKEKAQEKVIRQLRENEELKDKVNRELEQKVKERTVELEEQKKIVEDRNKDILDSIHYAKRIQKSILPTEIYIDKNLSRLK